MAPRSNSGSHGLHASVKAVSRASSCAFEDDVSLVLVNLSRDAIETTIALDTSLIPATTGAFHVFDTWNDASLQHENGYLWATDRLDTFPMHFAPYQARVLTIRATVAPA